MGCCSSSLVAPPFPPDSPGHDVAATVETKDRSRRASGGDAVAVEPSPIERPDRSVAKLRFLFLMATLPGSGVQ